MGGSQSTPSKAPDAAAVREGDVWNFHRNKDNLCHAVKIANGLPEDMHYSKLPVQDVKELLHRFRPVHRLNLDIFRKVLQSGSLQSRHLREKISSNPAAVLDEQIRSDISVRALMVKYLHERNGPGYIVDWISAWAQLQLWKELNKPDTECALKERELQEKEDRMNTEHGWTGFKHSAHQGLMDVATTILPRQLADLVASLLGMHTDTPGGTFLALGQQRWDTAAGVAEFRQVLQQVDASLISDEDRKWLNLLDERMAELIQEPTHVKQLKRLLKERAGTHVENIKQSCTTGIGFHIDKQIGTDRHVFCTIGPHFGTYYGDICIVLSQKVMYDPDFDMSPCAGTGFCSGNAKRFNKWLSYGVYDQCEGANQFHMARLNAGVLGWRSAMSAAIGSAIATWKGKKLSAVTQDDVREFWTKLDSHCVIEGHLPAIVSLDYVERVVLPENEYKRLGDDEKAHLKDLFGDKVFIVENTSLPSTIMSHCFEELTSEKDEGFCMRIRENHFRELRGVRPCGAGLQLRVRVRGAVQFILRARDVALVIGCGKVAAKASADPASLLGHPDVAFCANMLNKLATILTFEDSQDESNLKSGSLSRISQEQDPFLCWVATTDGKLFETFELPDVADWLDLRVRVGNTLQLTVAETTKKASWPEGSSFFPQHVAVRTGLLPAEIEAFKIM